MAEVSWIKIKINMFDDEKIRLIQAMPENNAILVIWIRLLSLAGKTNDDGLVYIDPDLPYSNEILATLFNMPLNTVKLAIETLKKFKMIDIFDNGKIYVVNWEKHQALEGLDKLREKNREYQKTFREKQKLLKTSNSLNKENEIKNKNIDKDKDGLLTDNITVSLRDPSVEFEKYLKVFTDFASKNRSNRASSLKEWIGLIPDQQQQAIIGAENYIKFCKESQTDPQYSKNSTVFLKDMIFMDYQEPVKPQPKKGQRVKPEPIWTNPEYNEKATDEEIAAFKAELEALRKKEVKDDDAEANHSEVHPGQR